MEEDVTKRFEKIEKEIKSDKKDLWDKLQAIASFFVPITIAAVGWYFTEQYNNNQLELQNKSADRQNEIENIKLQVAQAQLIKDLMQQLTSTDQTTKDLALASIVYSAPGLGKKIADIEAKSNPGSAAAVADIYQSKRTDLINSLFSFSQTTRLAAFNEIINSWLSDDKFLGDLITQALKSQNATDNLLDYNNGIYNSLVVFQSYPKSMLLKYKEDIDKLINAVPSKNAKTRSVANAVAEKIN